MNSLSQFYEEIRIKCRLSEIIGRSVSLTKKGSEYLGLCPFHTEKSPSFTINDSKGFYHCFGCSAHGDIIKFISEKYRITYQEAANKIAQENGIEIKKLSKKEEEKYKELDVLYNITEISANFYKSNITKEIKQYLKERAIETDLIEKFEIGFVPFGNVLYKFLESKHYTLMMMYKAGVVGKDDEGNIYDIFRNRIIFPIRNIYNKVVGFGGRVIGDNLPKYINSPDNILFHKKTTLYGENIVASTCYKTNNIIVVEGYFDVISMHQAGFTQTVASLGTAVTKDHLLRIFKMVDEIIICMDGDKAGINAAKKLIDNAIDLVNTKKSINFVIIPDKLDPDSFIKINGKESMSELLNRKIPLSDMIIKLELGKISSYNAENRALLEKNLDSFTSKITDSYLKKNFSNYFKDQTWKIFNKSKKLLNNNKMNIVIPELVSNISVIEKTMIYCIISNPIIMRRSDVFNFLSETILENKDLENLKSWILNSIDFTSVNTNKDLIIFLSSSPYAAILKTMNDNFVIPDFNNDESKLIDFWEILYMKHNLVKIKQEYFNIMSNVNSLEPKTLKGYENEISRLVTKIDVVTNKILMN